MRLLVSFGAAVAAGVLAAVLGAGRMSWLIGWDALALVFCGWVLAEIWRLDAAGTAAHAQREDPGRDVTDLMILAASLASLVAVGAVLFGAGHAPGNAKYLQAAFALLSVFVSWGMVHTVFTLKYARLYYTEPVGGIGFNEDEAPDADDGDKSAAAATTDKGARYSDFAYLAFTVGMTYQVSDTNLSDRRIRRAVLRQALLSYPLGAVIIAAAINLVSGLAK
ncbi:MAG: DUF1345 domain-containing protein [Actinocrinis sp.]